MKLIMTYDFVKWVLSKFELMSILNFAKEGGWKQAAIYGWRTRGIPKSLLALLQERLVNLKITGKISCEQSINLDDLFKEYQTELKE